MVSLLSPLAKLYKAYLQHPWAVLLVFAVICGVSSWQAQNFYYDASADTLVAENDPDLAYFREINEHFGDAAFLFLTYTPKNNALLAPETLTKLDALVQRLEAVEGVAKVTSLLDAPLLKSPPIPLTQMATGYKTLRSADVDRDAALVELTTSPLFGELLISQDGRTTAIQIDLDPTPELDKLLKKRNDLRLITHPTPDEQAARAQAEDIYRQAYAAHIQSIEQVLAELRTIRDDLQTEATAYLGGVPMIASDMMYYVRSDLIVFGATSVALMMLTLLGFFKCLRWVFLPVITTSVVLLVVTGLLGFMHKPVTVISSNFISLLIILSISIAVHLITRYRTFLEANPKLSHRQIVYKTMMDKIAPCLYTTLTTMAGFASLATSSIVPVMDFGWLMCVGVTISLIIFYLLFPGLLLLFPKEHLKEPARDNHTPLIRLAYRLAAYRTNIVLLSALGLLIFTIAGMSQLSLDNRFVDYFKQDTEIHQGLAFIDQHLGGTVPMEIIIDFPPYTAEDAFMEDDFFNEDAAPDPFPERYWFTPDKIHQVRLVQDYLANRPEIGKILSLATLEEIGREFNDGKPLGAVELIAILSEIPSSVRREFIAPYAVPEAGIMRISTRMHETGPTFSREQLIQDIKDFAESTPELAGGRVHVTGLNVLFNGMLRELFTSQTSTLFFVVLVTFGMFWILLRSPRLAIIGVLPNVFSAFVVLGFMGFIGIPLDMMTITIAAIIIGIGVDDAIHYLHFFKERYNLGHHVDLAVRESHREIGRALYITSLTVIIGFSVLCASNFVPTVYFGMLSAAAMVLALAANLVLLPALLLKFYAHKG